MKGIRHILLIVALATAASISHGQVNILDSVNTSGSTVKVIVPEKLAERLSAPEPEKIITEVTAESESLGVTVKPNTTPITTKTVGFRIQVYSDNNQRTARAEAEKRANAIRAHFPNYQVYVIFQSPYWRVKAGDFRSRSQAEEAAAQMREILPAYGKEMRVVKDHITIVE